MDTTKFLELGPKFVFPKNKFETLNDKVKIENLVHNISNVNNIEGNEKLSKIITEIRIVSGNYFPKQKTNRFKPNRNKLYLNKLQKEKTLLFLNQIKEAA